jgi:2-polyprenyl-3-methyl-5-hydroxy-6-metoxy-1,4-benzoquinol methylase
VRAADELGRDALHATDIVHCVRDEQDGGVTVSRRGAAHTRGSPESPITRRRVRQRWVTFGHMKELAKRLLFPGIDVHARSRYRHIAPRLTGGRTLDAGCGNGMFAWAAHRRGAEVVAVSNEPDEIERNRRSYREIHFVCADIREVEGPFEQVVCSEVLEHIEDDRSVVEHFARVMVPRGVLHVCVPNADHPAHRVPGHAHVRSGYTVESLKELLQPFHVVESHGIGSAAVVQVDRVLRRFGRVGAACVTVATLWLRWFDPLDPAVPFSVYVQAQLPSHCARGDAGQTSRSEHRR